MYVLVQHSITDAQKFFAAGEPLLGKKPAGLRIFGFYPAADAKRAACVWEGPSLAAVREHIDGVVGSAAKNDYTEIDAAHAIGLPR
jgi:hypothetical protein